MRRKGCKVIKTFRQENWPPSVNIEQSSIKNGTQTFSVYSGIVIFHMQHRTPNDWLSRAEGLESYGLLDLLTFESV